MKKQTEHVIIIGQDGTSRFLDHEDLLPLMAQGECRTQRASHVEPVSVFGKVVWWADLHPVHGPVLGPFETKSEGVAAEVQWLIANDLPVPSQRLVS